MKLTVVKLDESLTHLALAGKLDVAGEEVIRDEFERYTGERGKSTLVDMSEVSYLASLGIRLLFAGAKGLATEHRKLVILNPQPMVEETLLTSGTAKLIPIAHSMDEALNLLKG